MSVHLNAISRQTKQHMISLSECVCLCREMTRRLIESFRARTERETTPKGWLKYICICMYECMCECVPPPPKRPHSNQCCQQQTVYAFISNTPQTPALSNGFHRSRRDRDAMPGLQDRSCHHLRVCWHAWIPHKSRTIRCIA